MKNKLYVLFTLILFCAFFQIQAYAFDGGSGTIDDPYQVKTAADLNNVRNDLDAYYVQTDNIDISGYLQWDPIGSAATPFEGNYDGQDYIIDNLIINDSSDYRGLFGYTGTYAELKNINLENTSIKGDVCIGSLVGQNDGIILNCSSINCNIEGDAHVGGLVGRHEGILALSFSTGTIVANQNTGGLVGLSSYNNEGIIERCYSSANVTSNNEDGGGLVGDNAGIIKNCYATGNVDGNISGGLAGNNSTKSTGSKGKIINSYSTCNVTGSTTKGGLIARLEGSNATTQNSFWDKDTSGLTTSLQGTGKPTEEMQDIDTFTNIATDGLTDSWDLKGIWAMDGSYPYLREPSFADVTTTFVSNGGTTISEQLVGCYSKITKPTDPTKPGYTFAGWYKEETLMTLWDFAHDRPTKDTALYASWVENYDLNFVDLNNWKEELDGGEWEIEDGGRTLQQLINGNVTFYLSPENKLNTVINGTIEVLTATDNDYIGFVLGYQDVVDNHYEFVLFDWKQEYQAPVYEGYSLAKIDGKLSHPEPLNNQADTKNDLGQDSDYFWYHREDEKFQFLDTKWDIHGTKNYGWADNTEYKFKILYTYDRIKIKVNDEVIFDVNGSFSAGRLGFYNCSQQNVRYGIVRTGVGSSSNVAPVPQSDNYGIIKNDSLTIDCGDLFENDYDPDLDDYSMKIVETVSHGVLTYVPNNNYVDGDTLTYTPNLDYVGSDAFTYKLIDEDGMESEVVSVSINIDEINNAPTDITISNTDIVYQSPNGSDIGVLTTADTNLYDFHDYMLIDNSNGRFKIIGDTIKINDTSKILPDETYDITVRSTDLGGLQTNKIFTIKPILSIDYQENGGSDVSSETAYYNTLIIKPINPRKAGYRFAGWYSDKACTNEWNFINDQVTNNITLYAKWKKLTPTVRPTPAPIFVNGVLVESGTLESTMENGITTTTVNIDQELMREKLDKEGTGTIVSIQLNTISEVTVGRLNGQTVKDMENKKAVLEVKTENVTYILPADEINIDSVSDKIGSHIKLKDILVNVTIQTPTIDTIKVVQDTADQNYYQIIVPPVQFEITCTNNNEIIDVSKFNSYVERILEIPCDIVDPTKITTGIVLNNDGTFSHVPTKVYIDESTGKYYAKINSLTDSTYSVIYCPKEFADMEGHWAKEDVNDLGSRLVVNGVDENIFAADNDMTRAEFTAILVRALGLMRPDSGKDIFSDVNKTQWYYDGVSIAYEYGIVKGVGNAIFKPNNKITRQEAMVIISRAIELTNNIEVSLTNQNLDDILKDYLDSSELSSWAFEAAALCVDNEIIKGCNGKLYAKENITRAEAVAIVRRMLQKTQLIN